MYRAAGPPNPFGSPVQSKEVEMMMKILRTSVTAMGALLVLSASAQAQLSFTTPEAFLSTSLQGHYAGPSCTGWSSADWVACAGAIESNDEGEGGDPNRADVETFVSSQWGGAGTFLGSVWSGGSTVSGLAGDFVLAVKGSTRFSLFLFKDFNGADIDLTEAMNGVAPGHGISHVNLYDVAVSVPEPGMLMLMSTGLLGMAALRRRREDLA